jgi:hypothetical protein
VRVLAGGNSVLGTGSSGVVVDVLELLVEDIVVVAGQEVVPVPVG